MILAFVLILSPPSLDATADRVIVHGTTETTGVVSLVPLRGEEVIPILGSWARTGNSLRFAPRFPFEPGVEYQVALGSMTQRFSIPALVTRPAKVTGVFPQSEKLPANFLRFYLHFDREMRQGQGYAHFQLLDNQKKPVPEPFLILDEELWSDDGKRMTLLLDPGRVKQELVPRKVQGPVLVEGRTYTLVIRKEFKSIDGRPLSADFTKVFTTIPPFESSLDPAAWKIKSPNAASKEALELHFDRILDHALLQRVITIETENGRKLAGAVVADVDDARWRWCPEKPWVAGEYRIVIQGVLEDVCGNRIGAAFDAKLGEIGVRSLKPPTKLTFRVK